MRRGPGTIWQILWAFRFELTMLAAVVLLSALIASTMRWC